MTKNFSGGQGSLVWAEFQFRLGFGRGKNKESLRMPPAWMISSWLRTIGHKRSILHRSNRPVNSLAHHTPNYTVECRPQKQVFGYQSMCAWKSGFFDRQKLFKKADPRSEGPCANPCEPSLPCSDLGKYDTGISRQSRYISESPRNWCVSVNLSMYWEYSQFDSILHIFFWLTHLQVLHAPRVRYDPCGWNSHSDQTSCRRSVQW